MPGIDGDDRRSDPVDPFGRTLVEQVDDGWWNRLRAELEDRFAQDELVIRAQTIRRL